MWPLAFTVQNERRIGIAADKFEDVYTMIYMEKLLHIFYIMQLTLHNKISLKHCTWTCLNCSVIEGFFFFLHMHLSCERLNLSGVLAYYYWLNWFNSIDPMSCFKVEAESDTRGPIQQRYGEVQAKGVSARCSCAFRFLLFRGESTLWVMGAQDTIQILIAVVLVHVYTCVTP